MSNVIDKCRAERKRNVVTPNRWNCAKIPLSGGAPHATPGAQRLQESLRLARMSREIAQLRHLVSVMAEVIDLDELDAIRRIEASSPSNAQLKIWAAACEPPAQISDQPEECPW